jgi:mono/diheme cytochrome c family protein
LIRDFTFFARLSFQEFDLVDLHHACPVDAGLILKSFQTWETSKMKNIGTSAAFLLSAGLLSGLAACTGEGTVSYARDVQPILQANCLSCHQQGGAGYEASGFSMASYDELMKGTNGGPMIIAGDSAGSNLIVLMEGRADPSISMPHGSADPVGKADIDTIRRWIDQGAKKN